VALDPQTGDLVNANFISIANLPAGAKTHAFLHSDGQRVLISHQTQDVVYAYDLNGTFLGVFAPAGGPNPAIMDNVRGMAFHPTTGNFLVTSAGGTNINAVVEFDLNGVFLGTFIAPGAGGIVGPWSILFRASDVLVSASGDGIYQYDHNGMPISVWNAAIQFPEQIGPTATSNILAAAFSSPSGVWEMDANGNQLAIYNVVTSNRGVYELPNGNILTSNSAGVHEITRNNTLVRTIIAGNSYMISLAPFGPTPTPTPTATPTCPPAEFQVLIVYADSEGPPTQLQSQISAEPGVTTVDLFDAAAGTPTLGQLQQYDIVVPFSNSTFLDSNAIGNNLADYVDGGGIVVQYGFAHYGPNQPFGINGRWVTDNYNPYNYSTNLEFNAFSLGTFNAGHPLMAGVTTLNSNFANIVTPAAGATEVAQNNLGNSLVAFRPVTGGHTTVGVNPYGGAGPTPSGDAGSLRDAWTAPPSVARVDVPQPAAE